jgi:hypothetical protein
MTSKDDMVPVTDGWIDAFSAYNETLYACANARTVAESVTAFLKCTLLIDMSPGNFNDIFCNLRCLTWLMSIFD